MDHSFEEIRSVIIDILAQREKVNYAPSQFAHLKLGVAEVFQRREGSAVQQSLLGRDSQLSRADRETVREVFWDLFRQGVIMIGADDANEKFPFFSVTTYGKRVLDGADPYFFFDADSFENRIRQEIPDIDDTTLLYLKEAMQAFRAGCILSCSVMLGVATEHAFLTLMETIDNNPAHAPTYVSVSQTWMILTKVNRFKTSLDQNLGSLPRDVREDLDVHFSSILSVIRNYRNQSGHPTGKVVSREQAYVLMQLFIPYCKKIYQLRDHFK